jgi:hypothetical protein
MRSKNMMKHYGSRKLEKTSNIPKERKKKKNEDLFGDMQCI